MLIGDNTRTQAVRKLLSAEDLQSIKNFLRKEIDSWCKTNKGEWFYAHNLVGGDWEYNDLRVLYYRYRESGKSHDYAFSQAARDVGKILKQVLVEDSRTFETKGGYKRCYRLKG